MFAVDADRRGQWLRGVLDLCLLALLADRESYGYELAQSLQAAGIGPIQGGTLYPVLMRLQKTGLVTARWHAGESGPARKYYRLTTTGAEALRGTGSDWRRFSDQVNGLLEEVQSR